MEAATPLESTKAPYCSLSSKNFLEGYGFQYFSSTPTSTPSSVSRSYFDSMMRSPWFWVFFLWFVGACSSSEAFRAFVQRLTQKPRTLLSQRTRLFDPLKIVEPSDACQEVDGETALDEPDNEEQSQSSNSSNSFRETSRILLQVATEKGMAVLPFKSLSDLNNESQVDEWAAEEEDFSPEWQAQTLHFCFLVHGHRGYSKDLGYLQHVMRKTAYERRNETIVNNTRHDMVIYSPSCNEKKTDDGVVAGGDRLVEELEGVIEKEIQKRQDHCREHDLAFEMPLITLSFVGNSLGGLYARYAVAKLAERCTLDPADESILILKDRYRLRMNIFCTTATPHLGCASNTFIKIPRTAELGIAHGMGETGRDLFRVNDLLRKMATLSHYIQPLRLFRQRIAFANAYKTDFPVPAQTAAFLNEQSDYPHFFAEGDDDLRKTLVEEHSDLHIATMHTRPNHVHGKNDNKLGFHDEDFDNSSAADVGGDQELVIMSRSLDSLGWKKVFVDPRKFQPKLKIPTTAASALARLNNLSMSSSGSDQESFYGSEDEESENAGEDGPIVESSEISRLKARGVAGSSEVFQAVTQPPEANGQPFHWPFGHNMIVAMSRNSVYTYLNKGGRPIVHAIAFNLVEDIYSDEKHNNEVALVDTNTIQG